MPNEAPIPVPDALDAILARAPAAAIETVPVDDALGRTLAADLRAVADHPNAANSALDGYACRTADTSGASSAAPARLRVIGEVPAGRVFEGVVGAREAVAIYTGGAVPAGADGIVPVEATERDGDAVLVRRPASAGDIRPRAQDIARGAVGLTRGRRLDAAALALAAALGHAALPVARMPRVGVLATGGELVPPGGDLAPGQVFDANATGIGALVRAAGGVPEMLPRVGDDMEALHGTLERARGLDLILTSGGVSMGRYDLVRDVMFRHGEVDFWKVAMKPGGPVLFGAFGGTPLLGLPGNPVSSLVVFLVLGRAFVERALGSAAPPPYRRREVATAAEALPGTRAKETFLRVRRTGSGAPAPVSATGSQSSGVLRSMADADALAVVPPDARIGPGESVEILDLAPLLR